MPKRENWHTVHVTTETKEALDSVKEAIESRRRDNNEYPAAVPYSFIIKMLADSYEIPEQRPVVNPPGRVNFSRGTVYGSGN